MTNPPGSEAARLGQLSEAIKSMMTNMDVGKALEEITTIAAKIAPTMATGAYPDQFSTMMQALGTAVSCLSKLDENCGIHFFQVGKESRASVCR